MSEQNEKVVRDLFENATQKNYDAFDELVTPDYAYHPDETTGPDALREMVEGYHAGLSGMRVTVDQQFSVGDYVATRFTVSGTHDGDLFGTPASGKDVSFTGITISRCEDGRIAEEWELVDVLGLLGQIGALPAEPAQA
jgi:steroid delta-isomerase-like uncharacterized protein